MTNPIHPRSVRSRRLRRTLPPEVVRLVSEGVYRRLMEDQRIEAERRQGTALRRGPGGR